MRGNDKNPGTGRLNVTPVSGFVVTASPGFSAIAQATRSFTNLTVDLAAQDFLLSVSIAPPFVFTTTGTSGTVTWTGVVGITYQPDASRKCRCQSRFTADFCTDDCARCAHGNGVSELSV